MREFMRAEFSIDALENAKFEGFTDGDSWNGWACPYFTRETAEAVLKASEKNGFTWQYDNESRSFLVQHSNDPQDYEPERFSAMSILVNGAEHVVYAIGAYSWVWETP